MPPPRRDPEGADGSRLSAQVASHTRNALQALLKGARTARMYAGQTRASTERFRSIFLTSLHAALAETPVLMLEFTQDSIHLADARVLEGSDRRGDMIETLFAEGVRAVTVERGVTDDELMQLAGVLLEPWNERPPSEPGMGEAIWEADFANVHFEIVEKLGDEDTAHLGDSPVVHGLEAMVREINQRAQEAGLDESHAIRQNEFAVLLRLRDSVVPGSPEAARLASTRSPALVAEVGACNAGTDLERCDIGGLMGALAYAERDPARAKLVGAGLASFIVGVLESGGEAAATIQRALRLFDPDFTPDLPGRAPLLEGVHLLCESPLLERLAQAIAVADPRPVGPVFSLFSLLAEPGAVTRLGAVLPVWAVQVLADTRVLRAADDTDALDTARAFLAGPAAQVGLGMAARIEDPRLIEPVLAHGACADPAVRELVLVAVRKYQTPRIREFVRSRLSDPEERVRLEALRYCVAYRDVDVGAQLAARLGDPAMAAMSEAELRAVCIAAGRLRKDEVENALVEFALGTRRSPHPELPRMALHGLRAIGTARSQAALQRVAQEVPRLSEEAAAMLRPARS
jgi:hypothetical protein